MIDVLGPNGFAQSKRKRIIDVETRVRRILHRKTKKTSPGRNVIEQTFFVEIEEDG